MSAKWNCSADEALERAVAVLFDAIVADGKGEAAALAEARAEFLRIATWVGPSFQCAVIERAAELAADLPVAPEEAARAIRWDCRKLFGRDLCWADLGAVEPWGSA